MIRPVKQNETSQTEVPVRKCSLCMKQPVSRNVTLSAEKMNKHLLEIHWVTKPELNEHYCIPASSGLYTYGAQPGHRYERSEPQVDDEEIEADNNLEEKMEVEVIYYPSTFEDDEDEDEEGSVGSEETDF